MKIICITVLLALSCQLQLAGHYEASNPLAGRNFQIVSTETNITQHLKARI